MHLEHDVRTRPYLLRAVRQPRHRHVARLPTDQLLPPVEHFLAFAPPAAVRKRGGHDRAFGISRKVSIPAREHRR